MKKEAILVIGIILILAIGLAYLIYYIESSKPNVKEITFSVAKSDTSSNQITNRIIISDTTTNKDFFISIAHDIKGDWNEKYVCYFYLPEMDITNFAYSRVAYLPNCSTCPTDLDEDGEKVEYSFIGYTKKINDQ